MYFLIFQPKDVLNLCLTFNESQFSLYMLRKNVMFKKEKSNSLERGKVLYK